MFRLDFLSCFLTILATILVGRKSWTGLAVSIVNSAIVCVIGVHTSQYGFIPANLFCIGIYSVSIRSWLKGKKTSQDEIQAQSLPSVAEAPRRNGDVRHRSLFLVHSSSKPARVNFGSTASEAFPKAR